MAVPGIVTDRAKPVDHVTSEYRPCILTGWCLLLLVSKASSGPGTTPNIKEKFIERCEDYLQSGGKQSKFKLNPPSVTNCTVLWSTFSDAWIGNPVNIDYDPFFDAAKQPDIKRILLWSGTYNIAHNYSRSGSCYVTLEDTFIGHLVNGLSWCGPGIDNPSCPDDAKKAFWNGASTTFAKSLKENGLVLIMLDGSNPSRTAFNQSSVASMYELPNLPKSSIIRTILFHDINRTAIERCDNGSLLELKEKLEELKFEFHCNELPKDLAALFSADIPLKHECEVNSGTTSATSVLKYLCPFIVFVFFTSL